MNSKYVVVSTIESHVKLFNVGLEFFGSQYFSDFNKLVVVILALEERFFLENHACEHAAERPNVQTVVVNLKINQKFWALKIPACNSYVVLLAWMVELSKSPINKS